MAAAAVPRELALFGALLPLGVIAQVRLWALTVENGLAPGYVMGHYILSMILLDAAFALAWCATYEPSERERTDDRAGVWAVRFLLPLGALTFAVVTAVTAAGPHAGGAGTVDLINRLDFRGQRICPGWQTAARQSPSCSWCRCLQS